jgi:hypothetical protein
LVWHRGALAPQAADACRTATDGSYACIAGWVWATHAPIGAVRGALAEIDQLAIRLQSAIDDDEAESVSAAQSAESG